MQTPGLFDFDDDDEILDMRSTYAWNEISDAGHEEADSLAQSGDRGADVELSETEPSSQGEEEKKLLTQVGDSGLDQEVPESVPASPCENVLCLDACGVLRGSCNSCRSCPSWYSNNFRDIRLCPRALPSSIPVVETPCERCGCSSTSHKTLSPWLDNVRDCINRFRKTNIDTERAPPATTRLPTKVLGWDPADVALHVLTLGKYDYEIHRSPEYSVTDGLVSVCVPTSTQRHEFHPLLYENFRRQTSQAKELVVVDIGPHPSIFFQEKARSDARIIYRYFRARDATVDRRPACDRQAAAIMMKERMETWSLGLKRNLCCQLARGSIIVHFDDDDLYSSDYLRVMCSRLIEGIKESSGSEELGRYPSIATLSQWHMMDMPKQIFRWMDPATEEMPKEWREPMIYGYGFSYIYTRAAWLLHAFPDAETSEDDVFMKNLRKSGVNVTLVELPKDLSGLVAHVNHSDNTGLMEWNGRTRQGKVVEMPAAFQNLMPFINTLAANHPSRRAAKPPLTQSIFVSSAPQFHTGKGKGKGTKGKVVGSGSLVPKWWVVGSQWQIGRGLKT